jgi:hypothetical protein
MSDAMWRIEAALEELPEVAEPLATYLENLVAFKRAAAVVVDAMAEQEIWIPSVVESFPPVKGSA